MAEYTGLQGEKGATLVESAIVYLVLFSVLVISFELLRASYVGLTIQFTVTRVLRDAVVGPQVYAVSPYDASPTPYEEYILANIEQRCRRLMVSVDRSDISIGCRQAASCTVTAAQPGALVQVEVQRPTRILLFRTLLIRSIAMARNEIWRP